MFGGFLSLQTCHLTSGVSLSINSIDPLPHHSQFLDLCYFSPLQDAQFFGLWLLKISNIGCWLNKSKLAFNTSISCFAPTKIGFTHSVSSLTFNSKISSTTGSRFPSLFSPSQTNFLLHPSFRCTFRVF